MTHKAIISVSDKAGIEPLARFLVESGFEILSTGGTAKFLESKGIPYMQVSEYTGFPEMLDGRLKTLQPKIHGGILARRELKDHQVACEAHQIEPIDWVIVNLYPFAETIRKPNCSFEDAIENIDIGGPTLLRAASKNFKDVVVCVDPSDYDLVMSEYKKEGAVSERTKLSLATKVFMHTAAYDALIQDYLNERQGIDLIDRKLTILGMEKCQGLRYGENPHQRSSFFSFQNEPLPWTQLQGKELSHNNLIDLTAAYELVREFQGETACVIVKHTNPCGVGVSKGVLFEAFERAKSGDPVSAFGGIVALSKPLDGKTAQALSEMFLEVVVAPSFSPEARQILDSKKNLRLIEIDPAKVSPARFDLRRVLGGVLIQTPDSVLKSEREWQWVTERKATEGELKALSLAWKTVKHVKSNAIVFANEVQTLGVGAGQMSRVDSVRLAGVKSQFPLKGAVLASDAFFPFRDNIDEAAKLGITAIVEPGGSVRDEDSIKACNEQGIAMAFTGERHFKH